MTDAPRKKRVYRNKAAAVPATPVVTPEPVAAPAPKVRKPRAAKAEAPVLPTAKVEDTTAVLLADVVEFNGNNGTEPKDSLVQELPKEETIVVKQSYIPPAVNLVADIPPVEPPKSAWQKFKDWFKS